MSGYLMLMLVFYIFFKFIKYTMEKKVLYTNFKKHSNFFSHEYKLCIIWNLPIQTWVKKTLPAGEIHWLYYEEKVPGAAVSKEDHADSHLGHKRIHH